MIRNVLLPEKVNDYYVFPQRAVGLEIRVNEVIACKSYMYGTTKTLEALFRETVPNEIPEALTTALANIKAKLGKYDILRTAFPSSLVTFRSLTLPFISRDKIELVLPYEVEKLLPFSTQDALLDFIITEKGTNHSTILVAATQKQHVAEHIAQLEAGGLTPTSIIVDLFAAYEIWKQCNAPAQTTAALIILGMNHINIGYIKNGQLVDCRTIKTQSEFTTETISSIGQTLTSFGRIGPEVTELFICSGNNLINVQKDLHSKLNMPVTILEGTSFINKEGILGNIEITNDALISCVLSLPNDASEYCSLMSQEFEKPSMNLFAQQLFTALGLFITTIIMLFTISQMQLTKVEMSIKQSEQKLKNTIQSNLNVSGERNVERLVEEAQSYVETQNRIWFAFSRSTRSSFLTYLEKLCGAIDTESTELKLKNLTITHDLITLKGEVKDIPALVIFEEELNKAQLGTVSRPQEPAFNITITLSKDVESI
ncbi:pilus assembly protein PilM [Candidatus Babeliales bacterium]|nr:pilus assembly protein PilM [Candidatus Babeliales bacterium]